MILQNSTNFFESIFNPFHLKGACKACTLKFLFLFGRNFAFAFSLKDPEVNIFPFDTLINSSSLFELKEDTKTLFSALNELTISTTFFVKPDSFKSRFNLISSFISNASTNLMSFVVRFGKLFFL